MSQLTKEDVLKFVKEQDIKFIHLWFTDILGHLKSFAITDSELEHAIENGMGFDGSSITGFHPIEESDLVAKPDINTLQILPWRPKEKACIRMICDIFTPEGQPYQGCPRYILKRALQGLEKFGFSHYYVGPEVEFFYFKSNKAPTVLDVGSYFDLTTLDAADDLKRETILTLEQMGIPVEYSHHEVGPSQHEIDIKYGDALRIADAVMTYRTVVKEIAKRYNVYATFMPKPIFGISGSGMHVHQSLFRQDKNAFFDLSDEYYLSDEAKWFIAGQLYHAKHICAIFAQWVNSYKRLVPGYEAPVYIAWSRRNRSALIRVPEYHPGKEQHTRVEFRPPDPACNPYLTFAVMLQAGLDGIENEYPLPPPIEKNLYELSREEREKLKIEALPDNLGEAIALAKNSKLVCETLGEHTFSKFIELKCKEWEEYRIQVSEYELKRYFPIL